MQLNHAVSFCCIWPLRDVNLSFLPCYNKSWTCWLICFCFVKEVKDILHNVVLRNMVRESMHVKKEAFEAWRRVIEITLASCPADILPKDTRQTVIAEVLQDLLSKVHCKGCLDFFGIKQFLLLFWEWLLQQALKIPWKHFLWKGCENEKFSFCLLKAYEFYRRFLKFMEKLF